MFVHEALMLAEVSTLSISHIIPAVLVFLKDVNAFCLNDNDDDNVY